MSAAAVTQADLLNALNTLRAEMAQLKMRREGEDIAEMIIPPVNGADTAFILICTVLVLMMTLPGLALFYGGLSQATNVLGTVMQSFAVTCLVTFLWLCFGYTIAFGPGETANDFIGGNERLWLNGIDTPVPKFTLPEALFCIFQCTFAIITAAIITGSTAERMRFGPLLVFLGMWHIFVYCPLAHFEWGGGFMSKWGVLDFAGGDVVHISSGVSGLAASIIIGKRKAYSQGQAMPPHNVLLVFMGGSLLWVGWFGFNGGSAVGSGQCAAMAMLVTHISASVGGLAWILIEWIHLGKPSVIGAVSGAIAGLVVITPGSGFIDQSGAFVCGLTAAPVCYLGIRIKKMCGYDDALDAFGVHGIGGIWGGIMTGLWAKPEISAACGYFLQAAVEADPTADPPVLEVIAIGASGAFYGYPKQLGIQIAGICFTCVYSFVMTMAILLPMHFILKQIDGKGVRVSDEVEDAGLDISEHGESMVAPAGQPFIFDADKKGEVLPVVTLPNGLG
jgi:Amt family ammonium transporter